MTGVQTCALPIYGQNLSGGQRQRLAIARALLRSKSILILDEATANVDQETAEMIENDVLAQVETVIMVSHHLSDTIRQQLDQVISLSN